METQDTPVSFEEVAGAAIDAQATSEPLQESESGEPALETATPEGQVDEQQTQEESFTTFNPNDLTPEMLSVYKRWQSDYTQKRQAEKAELKDLRDKVAAYEANGANPTGGQPSQSEIATDYQTALQNGQIDPKMSLADYSKWLIEQAATQAKAVMQTEQENTYIEAQEKAFYALDPRFTEGPGQDKVLLNYVAAELGGMRDTYEQQHGNVLGFDFVGEAKKLIESYDGRISSLKKETIAKQSEMAKANAARSSQAMPKTVTGSGKPSGKISFEDAASAAFDAIAN